MNTDRPECLSCCAGRPPYFMCRDKRCICHIEMDLLAQKKYRAGSHRDPTYFTALRNINNEQREKNDCP